MKKQINHLLVRAKAYKQRLHPQTLRNREPFLLQFQGFRQQLKECRELQVKVRKLSKTVGKTAQSIKCQHQLETVLPKLHSKYNELEKQYKKVEVNPDKTASEKKRAQDLFLQSKDLYFTIFPPHKLKQLRPQPYGAVTLQQLKRGERLSESILEETEQEKALIQDLVSKNDEIDEDLDRLMPVFDQLLLKAKVMSDAIDTAMEKEIKIAAQLSDHQKKVKIGIELVDEVISGQKGSKCCMYVCVITLLGVTILLACVVLINKL